MSPALLILTALIPVSTSTSPVPPTDAAPTLATAAAEDAPAAPTEPKWTGSVTIGASYSDGNTDARSVNAAAEAERRAEKDRWTAKAFWNYGETKNTSTGDYDLTQRRAAGTLKYDYFMSKKLYVFGIGGIETDTLADIKTRIYAGGGAGYQWKEEETLKWSSEVGLTYFDVDFKSSEDREYLAARLANNVDWKINESTTFQNLVELFPSLEDANDFYAKSDTKIRNNLSKTMYAQLQWVFQFNNQPAAGKDRNDNLLLLGVGWSF